MWRISHHRPAPNLSKGSILDTRYGVFEIMAYVRGLSVSLMERQISEKGRGIYVLERVWLDERKEKYMNASSRNIYCFSEVMK